MTDDFEGFVSMIDPQLRRALSGHLPAQEVADAVAESFAYAWEHWTRVQMMENPAGYLYRVAQSKARARKQGFLPWPSDSSMPNYEPGLAPALDELSPSQQRAVWRRTSPPMSQGTPTSSSGSGTRTRRARSRLTSGRIRPSCST